MPMAELDVIEAVLECVRPFVANGTVIDADTLLIGEGHLDSLNLVQVLLALEGRFAITLGPSNVTFDDFESGRRLGRVIAALLR